VGVTREGRNLITYPAPDWIEIFEDFDGRGLVLCDELTTAPPGIQAAMLGLVNDKRIGGATLPAGVRVMAAANDPDRAAGGYALTAPLANRLGHLNWSMYNEDEWADHMLTTDTATIGKSKKRIASEDPAAEEARVLAAWPLAWARTVGVVTAFHRANRGKLHNQPGVSDPSAGKAWASHRTWKMAAIALTSAAVHGLSDGEAIALVEGFVGPGAAREFLAFQHRMDLPDPARLIAGTATWAYQPDRLDRSMAVISSLCSYALSWRLEPSEIVTDNRVAKLWEIIGGVKADDVIACGVKPLAHGRLTMHPAAIPVLTRLRPLFSAAGV
jgi:hypothetical protein